MPPPSPIRLVGDVDVAGRRVADVVRHHGVGTRITPVLVAGNWKMFKGPRETVEFLDAFAPPAGRRRRRLPAVRVARRPRSAAACPSTRRTCTGPPRARSPARSRRRCSSRSASRARSSGTPSDGSTSARRTRPCACGARRRSRRGCRVIACVGETEAAARGRGDRGRAAPPGRRDPAARAPRDRLRAGLGDRDRQDRDTRDRAGRARADQGAPRDAASSTAARSSRRTPPS